ncbi:hypothetical protein SAPIO_CDS4319 [Scedosporium apiospermum]|uniref:Uncharacterized protein n=1 Tax=Pseudallescheria apiosperma TaxID=563466 RepID=A0A084G8N7_PSEDA|nr:uncharacterized protein SAPIO_CDS4319 [Scedosporium apiospermum]KEZ43699.1 hypothetical protein SAPIO_CDS4319 [Scedosporium apiospermum]
MYTEPALARFPEYGTYTALLAGATFLVFGFDSVAYLSSVLLRLKLEGSADPFIFCILVANALPALTFGFVAYHIPSKSLGCLVAIGAFVRTYFFLTVWTLVVLLIALIAVVIYSRSFIGHWMPTAEDLEVF